MTDPIDSIHLQLLPDWLKETDRANPYANFRGDEGEPSRPGRQGGPGFREQRTPRKPRREGASGGGMKKPAFSGKRSMERKPRSAPVEPATVHVELLPETHCLDKIATEIKSTHYAYGVFALARMFLQQPERYTVSLVSKEENKPLYQLGKDGPVATSPEILERGGFLALRERYYKQEVEEVEAPKGNFSNVARCRLSGALLGPTNHHAYQPALRALYEKRFSRRMSFAEYSGRNIEIVNDPAVIEQWKEEAQRVVKWIALEEDEPQTFTSEAAAQAHFREHYFPKLLKSAQKLTLDGSTSTRLQDRALSAAIREAWFRESKFPGQLVRELSAALTHHGLHLFKHRKRFLYVASARPQLFAGDVGTARESVIRILDHLREHPGIRRKELAEHVLTGIEGEEAIAKARLELASDLHWLLMAGHVIEFQDGKLDLPLTPKIAQAAQPPAQEKPQEQAAPVEETPALSPEEDILPEKS